MYLLVDPIVLCLPRPTEQAEIDDFVRYILAWNDFLTDDRNTFYITQECDNALCRHPLDCFRYRPNTVTSRFQDSATISRASERVINYFLTPNHFLKIENLPDLIVFCEDISLNPDLVMRTHDKFTQQICEVGELNPTSVAIVQKAAESLQEALGFMAYSKEIRQHPILSNLFFFTYPINGNNDNITISAPLLIGDEELQVSTDLSIVGTPEDLLRRSDLTDIWTDIWTDTRAAIDRAVIFHKDNNPSSKDIQLSPYTVGPEFNESLEGYRKTSPSLLNQCFQTIASLLAKEHVRDNQHLRTSKGGNSKQMESEVDENTWKAWRVRINRSRGAEYRLHYWRHGDKYVFSNVVSKNDDMTIFGVNEDIVAQIE